MFPLYTSVYNCKSQHAINSHLPSNLLLNGLCIGLCKEGEQGTAEVVGVAIGVAQLVGYGIQKQVPA